MYKKWKIKMHDFMHSYFQDFVHFYIDINMNIQKIKLEQLKPAKYNPRKDLNPEDEEYKKMLNSIKEFGFVEPIIVNKDMTVIGGHQRLKVLKELGFTEVECNIINLDKNKEKALNIALNKITGDWDDDKLEELLAELEETDIDMALTGFSFDEIDDILDDVVGTKEDDFDEDKVLKEIDEVKTKYGNIYILGNHRLMCGDSTKEVDVNKLMQDKKADMVFTDPPYAINYQSNARLRTDKFDVLKNDDKILDFFPIIKKYNKGFLFICTTWKTLDKWIPLFNKYYNMSNMIIWNKGGGGIGDLKHTFATDYEIILCSNNGKEILGKRIGSVWDIRKDSANDYEHPTQKPIELSAIAIEQTTKKNNIILDLFGGSGSTLIAREQLGRKCYMMELDPKYCDVIIKRWEDFTGQKATLEKMEVGDM